MERNGKHTSHQNYETLYQYKIIAEFIQKKFTKIEYMMKEIVFLSNM